MLIDELKKVFDHNNFFKYVGANNEIDGINSKLIIREDSSIDDKLKAINLCALVGFYCTAIDLPIVKVCDVSEISEMDIEVKEFSYPEIENNSSKQERQLKLKSMNKLSEVNSLTSGLLLDTDNDFLPDIINAKIIISKDISNNELIAACNIATILGLNSLGCCLDIACTEDTIITPGKVKIYIGERFKNDLNIITKNNFVFDQKSKSIVIGGEDEEIISISTFVCENYNHLIKPDEVTLNDFENSIKKKLEYKGKMSKDVVFEKEYNLLWEVDEVKEIFENQVLQNLNSDDCVEIKVIVSEEKEIRDNVKEYIETLCKDKNINLSKCSVLCSYKQGLSWITEEVIPKIKGSIGIDKIKNIEIRSKAFLPKDKTNWDDEDGTIPNVSASNNDNENRYLDLPIRLIQELYPVDDLISNDLGISRDDVKFELVENNDCEFDYELVVFDKENNILLKDNFEVKYSERPYIDEFKGIGKVHPNTGLLEIRVNGEITFSKTIKTDVERIWDIYQCEILKECKDYILQKTNNNPTVDKQPFFNMLKLDILTSEPDYKIDVRQDIISVLSALHEDIYFVGLDFFKTFGMRTMNESLDEPGLILPVINKRNGQGSYMKATLIGSDIEDLYNLNLDIKINEINIKNGRIDKVVVDIDTSEETFYIIKNNIKSLEEEISKEEYNFRELVLRCNSEEVTLVNTQIFKPCEKNLDIREIKIPQDDVIGYEDYIEIVNKLKKVDGIKVWKASKSYQNRDIYAIEIIKKYDSNIISTTKAINNRPVLQINNRHHANEVSSTNSSFLLLEQLLTLEEYKKYLEKVNIVMIPFENVDGGYIHYELQKDNPEWQLHIARFNSVGKEFARDYFKEDSKYTESRALTNLWYKWLPDILTDNHGVPKHEWDQQFSGYTSPWFKGFWLPRALFYGYFWYLDEEQYPENKILSEAMQDTVSDYINANNQISKYNTDWKDRFEKYAHKWMPKLFPANYYKDLIYYWLPYKANKDSWHVSHRYPWITAVDWTTEVSDETAQGEYLELCSLTHNLADVATIDMMSKARFYKKKEVLNLNGEIVIKEVRVRPIQVN